MFMVLYNNSIMLLPMSVKACSQKRSQEAEAKTDKQMHMNFSFVYIVQYIYLYVYSSIKNVQFILEFYLKNPFGE